MPVRDLLSAAGGVGGGTDPNFNQVSLLLNGDGTNGAQNNTFTDSSANNISLTRNGNLTQGSFNPYGSLWSNYFNGTNSYITSPSSSAYTLGSSGDFTVDGWFYCTQSSLSGIYPIVTNFNNWDTGYANRMFVGIYNGQFRWYDSTGSTAFYTTPTVNTWNYFNFTRSGSIITGYLNGVSFGTQTTNQAYTTDDVLRIGGSMGNGNYFGGYISNVRIIKGAIVSGTTVPTAPATAISGTTFLSCQSNRFIDNSSNNFSLTATNSPAVQPFSPFNPTSAYDVTTTEGSGYFSTNSYLNFGNYAQVGSSDFTFETWVYPVDGGNYGGGGSLCCIGGDGNGYFGFNISLSKYYGVQSGFSSGSGWYGPSTSVTSAVMNQWYHVAVTRSSGAITLYLNGQSIGSGSFSNSKTGSENYIGYYTNHSSNYDSTTGYMAGWRLVIGSVVYSGNFTPPTAPPANVTNTALLPKFANAGIYDYSTNNVLQTVNNAQVNTSVKKFGTGSLYFDGGGSYLPTAYNQALAFRTGDFTIEFWMNSNNVSGASQKGILQTSPTAGGLNHSYTGSVVIFLGTNSSGGPLNGGIGVAINNYTIISPGTSVLTTGTWYHIAVVRQSGTVYIYVNGTSVVSASNSADITGTYLALGAYYDTGYAYDGYLDDVRITSGLCRYPNGTTFTPPTAALPTF